MTAAKQCPLTNSFQIRLISSTAPSSGKRADHVNTLQANNAAAEKARKAGSEDPSRRWQFQRLTCGRYLGRSKGGYSMSVGHAAIKTGAAKHWTRRCLCVPVAKEGPRLRARCASWIAPFLQFCTGTPFAFCGIRRPRATSCRTRSSRFGADVPRIAG